MRGVGSGDGAGSMVLGAVLIDVVAVASFTRAVREMIPFMCILRITQLFRRICVVVELCACVSA